MDYPNIKKLLDEQGKSRYQLKEALNSRYKIIDKYMNQTATSIHFKTLKGMAEFFNCEVSDLFKD